MNEPTVQIGARYLDVQAERKGEHRELVPLYVFVDPVRGPRVRCVVVGSRRRVAVSRDRLLSPSLFRPQRRAA